MEESTTKTISNFVTEVVERNGADRSLLTTILHAVQEEYSFLPEQALRDIASLMEIPLIDIYGVATFYTSFSLEPKGEHIVTVCMGTACHVRNSEGLLSEVCRLLGVKPGETTDDKQFTVEAVNCLGACAMGPIMVVDGEYYGEMNASKVTRILEKYRKVEVEPKTGARFASPGELDEFKKLVRSDRYSGATSVSLCTGPGCLAVGSGEVLEAFKGELEKKGLSEKVVLRGTGCHGFCERGPVVVIKPENIFYQRVAVDDVAEIVSETITQGRVIDRLLYEDPITGTTVTRENAVPYYSKQNRQILGPNVDIDPCEIGDFIATGGYSAMAKALFDMEPDQIIDEVDRAGLRGRGGGGFPAASKWKSCRDASSPDGVKYVLCNADEGDPGAFMDRCLLEGNPHSVLEGMVIGARAIGANNGYIYVRNEYPLAVTAVTRAIEHTAVKGLYLRPTNLNNVETWANVPLIIKEGADAYAQVGTENSKGTKIFSLVGKIKNTGLVEVPMGISLREIIYDIGGGIPGGKKFKAVQTGGPSGGCIPESLIDIPVDFDRLAEVGSMMGSGGMIVMDEDTCMVDIARYFLEFLCDESCGKCTPCREGLKHMLEIIDEITKGRGSMERLDLLEELADVVRDTSLCGLGQTAPNPVLSTIRYFKEEYRQHIEEKRCTAGVCKALISFEINQDACNGCTRCAKACPSGAISGEKKEPHRIDAEKCDKCGICYEVCEFDAVVRK